MSQVEYVVIGGGSAGCVVARRLSDFPGNRVTLIEAGADYAPSAMPRDILDSFAGHAWANPEYFWASLAYRRSDDPALSAKARASVQYEQGRVIGGGSSVNGQVALRGAPEDFNRWAELGATGWDWNSILPYFRRLENDLDFTDQLHGNTGPIAIRRIPPDEWDAFTHGITNAWEGLGYKYLPDLNGEFQDGYGAIPTSNDGERRMSTAIAYLDEETRGRDNLEIIGGTHARCLVIANRRVTGVEVEDAAGRRVITGDRFVLTAGAIHSPAMLMLSGMGPAQHLRELGIEVLADRPGVGANLQDHPLVSLSAYIDPAARPRHVQRRNYSYLRYSSGVEGCRPGDMVMMAVCRSAWHAVGERLGTLSSYVGQAFSRGRVQLRSPDPDVRPDVCFNYLADWRDRRRMTDSVRMMAAIFASDAVRRVSHDAFPSVLSDKVKNIAKKKVTNSFMTNVAATIMDTSPQLRRLLIKHVITEGTTIPDLLSDEKALEAFVCESAVSSYHPSGTCRMGSESDANNVTDPTGKVIGLENAYIADASIMPEVTRHNTNIPTIMIAERVADLLNSEHQKISMPISADAVSSGRNSPDERLRPGSV